MQQSSLYGAKALPPPVRSVLEQLLGRALDDSETISVRAYQPHEAPAPDQQQAAARELRKHFAEIDAKIARSGSLTASPLGLTVLHSFGHQRHRFVLS